MSPVASPLVDVGDIIRMVGQSSFSRGQAYAKSGAVESYEWDADAGELTGVVRGSTVPPYRCLIELTTDARGRGRPTDSSCTCPMSFDCKHVAAILLSSNAAHVRDATRGDAGTQESQPAAVAGEAGWKSVVGALIGPSTAAGRGSRQDTGFAPAADGRSGAHSARPTPMGLLFELRAQAPRMYARWRGPMGRTGTARQSDPAAHRLGVRPVVLSTSGNWVKSTVTWNNVSYQASRANLDPEQQRWFSQFAPLHRAGAQVYFGQDPDWLYLDDFSSPLLWHLFGEARRLGISLVGAGKDAVVTVGELADVSLDAALDPDGNLHLRATLVIDGEPVPAESAGAVGNHGVYSQGAVNSAASNRKAASHNAAKAARAELRSRPAITLAPTANRLTDEQASLLGHASDTVIPANDTEEFLTEFYPTLRHTIRVTSTDASVSFPEIAPPTLVLTATFLPKHTLRLEWQWEYRHGTKSVRAPLWSAAGAAAAATGRYRDTAAERDLLERAGSVLRDALPPASDASPGASSTPTAPAHLAPNTTLQGVDAAEFTEKTLPPLEQLDGVRVDVVGEKPGYRELTEAPKLTFTTVETDQRDWFDLGVLVHIEGRSVPFGPIFTALSKGQARLLMVDGTYLSLRQPAFEQLHELINEAQALAEWETGLRISRYHASLWSEFEDLAEGTEQAEAWRSAATGLLDQSGVEEIPVPSGLQATLRPYQVDGFRWLSFLWAHGLGGILADDMGLGKTLQTLALLVHITEQEKADAGTAGAIETGTGTGTDRRPFLIVAPTSVVPNWLSEAQRFAPSLQVIGIASTQKKSGVPLADAVAGADVIVTSYALFRLDFEAYQAVGWAGLILDEAQFVKNRASAVHACARDLRAPFKLAVTGTPMENNLTELWALFAVVAPGLFPSVRRFTEDYSRPIERGAGGGVSGGAGGGAAADAELAAHSAKLLARLRRRIRPLMMRRTKELVATELPAKQEQVLRIDLAPAHRRLYDMFLQRERQKLLGLIEDMDRNRFIVFRSLTLLRMLSLDASLVDEKYAAVPSTKLDALFEQLEDVVAEGHRALIFSQFTSFLGKAAAGLDARGVEYSYLDGSTTRRAKVIDGFKKGTAPVFLISLKAGGFGLNLTEADYVFLLDPWWNPATEEQAVDRTHRIGQHKNVMVYRMVATGTIEEKVMALKEKKARLFSSMMDDDAVFSSALTADDIRGLLDG